MKNPGDVETWTTASGPFSMSVRSHVFKTSEGEVINVGVPFGALARLLLSYVVAEAVKTRSPEIHLGNNLAGFLNSLSLPRTGGKRGSIRAVRGQLSRLLTSSFSATVSERSFFRVRSVQVANDFSLYWEKGPAGQSSLWQSRVVLSDDFFREITTRPVPVDMRALRALKGSPLRLDIYTWLTFKMASITHETLFPWEALHRQFGGGFGRIRDFKARFSRHLSAVKLVYPFARVQIDLEGLRLRPSAPSVPRLTR